MPPSRFAAEVERLRAAVRGKRGRTLIAGVLTQLESFHVAALVADDSARYIGANTAAEELTGYPMAELAQLSVMDVTPAQNVVDGNDLWREFVESGEQQGRYDLRRKDGSMVAVHYWAFANVAPGIHLSLLIPEATAQS